MGSVQGIARADHIFKGSRGCCGAGLGGQPWKPRAHPSPHPLPPGVQAAVCLQHLPVVSCLLYGLPAPTLTSVGTSFNREVR